MISSRRPLLPVLALVLSFGVPGDLSGAAIAADVQHATPAADSVPPESPQAPLLIPGRPSPGDSAIVGRAGRARQQYELGRALEKSHSTAGALAAYSSAVKLDPTIPDANYRMAMLLLARDQIEPAAKCLASEVEHHPENSDAIRQLGTALARLGQTGRAIQFLERLVRRQPRNGDTWHALGFAYLAAERPRNAESAFRRALDLPPTTFEERRDLGAALAALGREAEARVQYRRALALAPRDPTTWFNLANLDRRDGRTDSALVLYRRAEAFDSAFALALQAQVQILREQHREVEAVDVYQRWLRRHPEHHGARLEAVQLLESLGRGDEALSLARAGVYQVDEAPQAHVLLGMVLKSHGELRAAMAEFQRADVLWRAKPAEQERMRRMKAAIRSAASDSLRALFASDSVAISSRAPNPLRLGRRSSP